LGYKLIVALGYAENFIDRLYPRPWDGFSVYDSGENGPERLAKSQDTEQGGVDGAGLGDKQGPKTGGAILGDKMSVYQERNKFVPRKIVGCGGEIGKVQRKPAGDEMGSRGHITVECEQTGYIRTQWSYKKKLQTNRCAGHILNRP
jgi:hypothetical protein